MIFFRLLSFILFLNFITNIGLAKSATSSQISSLFNDGSLPTIEDGKAQWICYSDLYDDNNLVAGTDYGFMFKENNFILTGFGMSNQKVDVMTVHKNNALIASEIHEGMTSYLSIRAIDTSTGRRLIMEESTDFQPWQTNEKSIITELTPNVYSICEKSQISMTSNNIHSIFDKL